MLAILAMGLLLSGCGMQYTRHIKEGFQTQKITDKTFAIFPITGIDYVMPGACFAPPITDGTRYEGKWQEKITKNLQLKHPTCRFSSLSVDSLKSLNIDLLATQASAGDAIEKMNVNQISLSENNPLKIELAESGASKNKMAFGKLREQGFDFAIVGVHPALKGETTTTYNAGTGANFGAAGGAGFGAGGSTSTQTTFYSDLRFGVFSTETGELIYASGALASSSGFCFLMSPQDMSIDGSGTEVAKRISDLVAKVLLWSQHGHANVTQVGPLNPNTLH